ncbi:MAG: hypothetical protein AVDCRST_MAG52-476, partial [uncultured Blastococcus sp.]
GRCPDSARGRLLPPMGTARHPRTRRGQGSPPVFWEGGPRAPCHVGRGSGHPGSPEDPCQAPARPMDHTCTNGRSVREWRTGVRRQTL